MFSRFLSALSFAAGRHAGQCRKDGSTPYVNHLIEVAGILVREGQADDEMLLVAAVLHDTVEDTGTTYGELMEVFGADVTKLVREMTDDESLPKGERRRLQIVHAPTASGRAKQIKIADKISNIRDVIRAPAADWSLARRREYLDWAERVVEGCRGVNPRLDRAFDATLQAARAALSAGAGPPPE